jgi:hypothetical protein
MLSMQTPPASEGYGLVNFQTSKFKVCNFLVSNRVFHNRLINSGNVAYIEGENNYSYIHLYPKEILKTSKTLLFYEKLLANHGFFRCKSYLINRLYIKEIREGHNRCVHMVTGAVLTISKEKMDELLGMIASDNIEKPHWSLKEEMKKLFLRMKRPK